MNMVRAKPSVKFPGLYGFDPIQCTQEEWDNAKWRFRIVSESSDLEKDSGFNHCTVAQVLVDTTKTFDDEKLGKVYRVFLFLGEGNAQSFGKDDQYSVIPVEHLDKYWTAVGEHNKLFEQIAFMKKDDIIKANKLDIRNYDSDSSSS